MILVSLILLTFCHLEFFLVLICLCILCHCMCSYEDRKFAIKNLHLVSGRRKSDNGRLTTIEPCLQLKRLKLPGIKLGTARSAGQLSLP